MNVVSTVPRTSSVVRMMTVLLAVAGFLAAFSVSADAAGPAKDVIDRNDNAWACEGEAEPDLPPEHCINIRSKGNTGIILVFEPDPRGPQESISFDPKSDLRPCPHDPDAGDGTWWSVSPDNQGPWVCHHRP